MMPAWNSHAIAAEHRHPAAAADPHLHPTFVHPLYLVSATVIVMSGVACLLIVLFRWPLGEPHWSAPIKAFLLCGAVIFTWQEAARRVLLGTWCTYALALLVTVPLLFSPALALIGAPADVLLCAGLVIVWLQGLRSLLGGLREMPWWNCLAATLAGAVLGAAYFFIVNTKGYANVLSLEQTLVGVQHLDTLYHAAMAAMIANYGVASTGLDGLVHVPYHVLSHALIGLAGRWMQVSPIESYYLVPQIVLVPLLFFALATATFWLWRPSRLTAAGPLAVLVPAGLLFGIEIRDWASYLISESYCLALILLLLALPLLLEIIERPRIACALTRYTTLALVGAGDGPRQEFRRRHFCSGIGVRPGALAGPEGRDAAQVRDCSRRRGRDWASRNVPDGLLALFSRRAIALPLHVRLGRQNQPRGHRRPADAGGRALGLRGRAPTPDD